MERQNYFDVLGISPDASQEEIERSYRDKIKEHPPRKDPDGFQVVNKAGQLRDPDFRRDYIESLKAEDVKPLIQRAGELREQQKWYEAITVLEQALTKHPDLPALYDAEGWCYLDLGSFEDAVRCFKKAFSLSNRSAIYLGNAAFAYYRQQAYEKAQSAIEAARRIDPSNKAILILHTDILNAQEKYDVSESELRQAIDRDGKLDVDDLPLLIQLLWTEIYADKILRVKVVLSHIETVIFGDPDFKLYAFREIFPMAYALAEASHFAPAYELAVFCSKIAHDEELADFIGFLSKAQYVDKISADENIIAPLRRLVFACFARISQEDRDKMMNAVRQEIDYYRAHEPSQLRTSIGYIKHEYPVIYNTLQSLLDGIANSVYPQRQVAAASSSSSGSGDCFVATAAFGTPLAAEIGVLRKWRDTTLQEHAFGRWFIRFYYRWGPAMARFLNRNPACKKCVRWLIRRIISRLRASDRV